MASIAYSIIFSARLDGTAGTILPGDALIPDATTGLYVKSTTANRGTRRSRGVALAPASGGSSVEIQQVGDVGTSITGLGAGSELWIRVNPLGRLERVTTPAAGDDVIGSVEPDGSAYLLARILTPSMCNGTGGGSVPTVASIAPTTGSTAGGTAVSITVNSSAGCTGAAVGGVALTAFAIVDATHVSGVTGVHAAGAADVTVTNATGTSAPLVGAFTYAAAPTLTSLNYAQGDIAGGGQSIIATGVNCLAVNSVTILGASVVPTATTATTVTFTLPPHAAGVGTVSLTSPNGTSGTLPFEYWSPIQVTSVAGVYDAEKGITTATGVSAWTDQSAAALNLAQATGANQPAYNASAFGTLHGLAFTGAHVLSIGAPHLQAAGRSVLWVGKYTSAQSVHTGYPGDCPLTVVGDGSGGVNVNAGHNAGTISYQNYVAGWTETTRGASLNDGVARLYGVTHDTSGNVKQYVGATQQGATATGQTYNTVTSGWDNIGQGFGGSADGYIGTLGAVVVVDGIISGGDLTNLNAWAQQRFGTP
jgi:hypothetical protein